MDDIQMFSGGLGSWAAAKRHVSQCGRPPALLFTDTLIEDDDLYRFLVEAGADILGHPAERWSALLPELRSIPPLREMAQRKEHLGRLMRSAQTALPGLVWIRDGRTPWEVFHDERFVGNTMVARCSHILKQRLARSWLSEHAPAGQVRLLLGIGWQERHRFEGAPARGKVPATLGARQHWLPWVCLAPLCAPPYLEGYEIRSQCERAGIAVPRLYDLGFAHNNCMGACVKAGHAQWRAVLKELPEAFAYAEQSEQALRAHLDRDVAVLRDRRGGKTRPLPLLEFRERMEDGVPCDRNDRGGCGCFTDAE